MNNLVPTKLALARMFFAESHALYQDYFKAHGLRFASSIELSIVGRAVFMGYAEGKPMGLAQLERFLEMPRATLRRRLRDLMNLGYIERQGNRYVCRPEALNSPEMHRSIERARKLLFETYAAVREISRAEEITHPNMVRLLALDVRL
jgi:hypothetical protein